MFVGQGHVTTLIMFVRQSHVTSRVVLVLASLSLSQGPRQEEQADLQTEEKCEGNAESHGWLVTNYQLITNLRELYEASHSPPLLHHSFRAHLTSPHQET